MPQFAYKARRRSGETVQGTLEVADRTAALAQIERQGLVPVQVEAAKGSAPAAKSERKAERPKAAQATGPQKRDVLPVFVRNFLQRKKRPKLQELATYSQQLANLLHAGMPLAVALTSMCHLESKGIPKDVSKQLKQDVTEGRSLSAAMAKQSHVFSDLFINMVKAGEHSGALEDVLRRLASHFERFSEVQSKFKSSLVYPAIVASVGVLIMVFFMTFMLPRFVSIFEGFKVPLPAATQLLVDTSNFVSSYYWLLILLVIAGLVVWNRFQATSSGRRTIDHWKLNAPLLGKVIRLNVFAQFARTLSTLLVNGVPVLNALKISEEVLDNRIVKEAVVLTREAVTDGKTISQPLARSKIFPQLMIDLIKIGEETGDVPGSLKSVAETYENELTISLRMLTNMIEPAMIIVMAIGVGFLLFSVLSAMFAITSSITR